MDNRITLKKEGAPALENIKKHRLTRGNYKLHKVLIFDLPPGEEGSCSVTCPGCYAFKAQRQYPNVRKWREQNFILAKYYPEVLEKLLNDQLSRTRYNVVRIHSSGDFFSEEYIKLWYKVIENNPHLNFYAYTKVDEIFSFENPPKNFNLISSWVKIGDKKYLNYGSLYYLMKIKAMAPEYEICPATDPRYKGKVKCNRDCNYCINNNKILFVKH